MNTFRNLSLALVALCGLAFGQASFTTTTLSNAVSADASQSVVVVASATGVNGPALPFSQGGIGSPSTAALTWLMVDREVMRVNAVSGTTVSVERGYHGTASTAHAASAKVWVGPASYFIEIDPPAGSPCVATQLPVLPRVNYVNGNVWTCGNSKWTLFAPFSGQLTMGAIITAAATIAPTNPVFHVTGATQVATITLPPACAAVCQIVIIPDTGQTTLTSGNLAIASTWVVSKAITYTYSTVDTKWYPSY